VCGRSVVRVWVRDEEKQRNPHNNNNPEVREKEGDVWRRITGSERGQFFWGAGGQEAGWWGDAATDALT
jgi:hypothetical protein